jgi:hypothetical protein
MPVPGNSSHQSKHFVPPALFAHRGEAGAKAREALSRLDPVQRESVGQEIITKLLSRGWIQKAGHREAAKVVLEELALTSVATAQELGLTFAYKLRDVRDPWMRLMVGLEVSEILSRDRVCAPASTICYLQLFREFDHYYRGQEYAKPCRRKSSLFEPISLAEGDRERARVIALEMVLPFAEEALRLLWSLQAQAIHQGDAARRKVLAREEGEFRSNLSNWIAEYPHRAEGASPTWFRQLVGAVEASTKGDGVKALLPQATQHAKAITAILDDCLELLHQNKFREAIRLVDSLRQGLSKRSLREDVAMREHALAAGYVELLVRLRADDANVFLPTRSVVTTSPMLWVACEGEFNEPGALWSRRLKRIRKQVIQEVPLEWLSDPQE